MDLIARLLPDIVVPATSAPQTPEPSKPPTRHNGLSLRRPIRIVCIAGLFRPYGRGGTEDTALQQCVWLAAQGHEVHVLTARGSRHDEAFGDDPSFKVWRVGFPRPYPVSRFEHASQWLKPLWHLQELFDPRNARIVGEFLDRIEPELALIHFLPGIGIGALSALAQRDIAVVQYLHDLGLACMRMSMFRRGRECRGLCPACRLGARRRLHELRGIPRLGLCSPSHATLTALQALVPISQIDSIVIPNANRYPVSPGRHCPSSTFRLLYVGRLHPQKGVDVVAAAVASLQTDCRISLRIVGSGVHEEELRVRYGAMPWCSFAGHVDQERIAEEMREADALVVPSLWAENLAGVAIHALAAGLPVIASRIGALPELVEPQVNGLLVEPGDIDAWADAIRSASLDRASVERWSVNARNQSQAFQQQSLGERHLAFFDKVLTSAGAVHG